MRAVKDGLPTPYAEVEESERPRSTGAVEPTAGILPNREWKEDHRGSLEGSSVLAQRAASEGPHWMRAGEDHSRPPRYS